MVSSMAGGLERTAIFTSIVSNYLPKARVLAKSVKRHHPECRFVAVVVEPWPQDLDPALEPFDEIIGPAELMEAGLADGRFEAWVFSHSIVEASTAAKGTALKRLLADPRHDKVIFLDPDVAVFGDLSPLAGRLEESPILLTPHDLAPIQPEDASGDRLQVIRDHEIILLRHGVYNLGFLAVADRPEGRRLAAWWADRLTHFCIDDVSEGLFTDQRWGDLIPVFFPDTEILRDPGYNVAAWNLLHRALSGSVEEGLGVDGQPLRFYHFTGFDSGAHATMNDAYGSRQGAVAPLLDWYREACGNEGQEVDGARVWAYARYEDGTPVTMAERRFFRHHPDVEATFANPFQVAPNPSYKDWYRDHVGEPGDRE
jgi:hypothetical protein